MTARENQPQTHILDPGNYQHPDVSAADVGFINPNKKTDEKNDLTDLNRRRHDLRSIDSFERRSEELFVIEHPHLRFSASPTLPPKTLPCWASILISAPAFARSIARSRITSVKAACVYAFARTSQAAAP